MWFKIDAGLFPSTVCSGSPAESLPPCGGLHQALPRARLGQQREARDGARRQRGRAGQQQQLKGSYYIAVPKVFWDSLQLCVSTSWAPNGPREDLLGAGIIIFPILANGIFSPPPKTCISEIRRDLFWTPG